MPGERPQLLLTRTP